MAAFLYHILIRILDALLNWKLSDHFSNIILSGCEMIGVVRVALQIIIKLDLRTHISKYSFIKVIINFKLIQ